MFLLLISTPVSLSSALSPGTDISPGRPPQNNIFPAQVWDRRQNRKLVQHRTQVSAFLQSIWRNVNWNSNNKLVFKRLVNICFPLRITYISHTITSGKKLACVQVTWLYVSSSWPDDDWERVALSSTGTAAKIKQPWWLYSEHSCYGSIPHAFSHLTDLVFWNADTFAVTRLYYYFSVHFTYWFFTWFLQIVSILAVPC